MAWPLRSFSYDEPVLTDNVGDFTALGVDVETY